MVELVIFILASAGLIIFSLTSFRVRGSHGFYRFFAFETILLLVFLNLDNWFDNPFSTVQIVSWLLLMVSLAFVITGFGRLQKAGKPSARVQVPGNVHFENTSTLVTDGIYRLVSVVKNFS